jgi:hypothetical protein
LVNHVFVPAAQESKKLLVEIATAHAEQDGKFGEAWKRVPEEVVQMLHRPEQYTGRAAEKAIQIADQVEHALGA